MAVAERRADKLILLYPALCIPDDAKLGKMLFIRFNPKDIDNTLKCKIFRFSPEYPKSAINIDVYGIIEKISAPILIIHGNNDKIVNISYAEKAVKTAKSGKLSVLAGAGHGFNKRQIKTANKTMDVFLKNR
ncbi:MAG: alpha/beta hydrolase [Clostridia bacterium]|nr:alpha/beta hydrolase [Clostridia bacterium]